MRRERGFTLIELLIVILVVAVLAAIAVSSYKEQIRKSRRTEAYNYVAQVQLQLERWRAENPSYADCTPTPACRSGFYPSSTQLPLPTSTYYTLALSGAAATTYTITATPKSSQLGDRCGNLIATGNAKPLWVTSACN